MNEEKKQRVLIVDEGRLDTVRLVAALARKMPGLDVTVLPADEGMPPVPPIPRLGVEDLVLGASPAARRANAGAALGALAMLAADVGSFDLRDPPPEPWRGPPKIGGRYRETQLDRDKYRAQDDRRAKAKIARKARKAQRRRGR